MKKLTTLIFLVLLYTNIFSQCYNIDTTRIPFSPYPNAWVGFNVNGIHPGFMSTPYITPLAGLQLNTGFWFNISWKMSVASLSDHMYIFGCNNDTVGWYVAYNTGPRSGYLELFTDNNGLTRLFQISDTNWHTYNLTYDGSNTLTLTVDNSSVSQYMINPGWGIPGTYKTFCVGHKYALNTDSHDTSHVPTPYDRYFRGYIDSLQIQLQDPAELFPMTFEWPFNEGAGEYAHDKFTYKIIEGVIPGGSGYAVSNGFHLHNGCTENTDRYDATWFASPNGIIAPVFSPLGSGVRKWLFTDYRYAWEHSRVSSETVWDNKLIATGIFNRINSDDRFSDTACNKLKNIAYWTDESSQWNLLDSGLWGVNGTNDAGDCVISYRNKLFAMGCFVTAGGRYTGVPCNNIAQMDTINYTWDSVGHGVYGLMPGSGDKSSNAFASCVYQDNLYVGGNFYNAGYIVAPCIAKWNDTAWSDLNGSVTVTYARVLAMAVYNGYLYVGGTFGGVGNPQVTVSNLARWNDSAWSNPGINITGGWVNAMCVYNGKLYVGGNFTSISGTPCGGLACYDSSSNTWTAVASTDGLGKSIQALHVYNGKLYITGTFFYINGIPCYDIASYDGSTFCAISNGLEMTGLALTTYNGKLIIGGKFYSADGIYASNIVSYSTSDGDNRYNLRNNVVPQNPSLGQNYPNPFNPTTTIKYYIPQNSVVKIVIYDVLGREVKTLVSEFKNAGSYELNFDASIYASGVYFYNMTVGDYTESKKMLLIK